MFRQSRSSPAQTRPGLFFPVLLSWSGMLAAIVAIAYACVLYAEGAMRVRVILEGAEAS